MADGDDTLIVERCDFFPSEDDPTAIGLLVATHVEEGNQHVTHFVDPAWLRSVQAELATDPAACGGMPPGVRLPSVALMWPEEMNEHALGVVASLHEIYVMLDCDWTEMYRRIVTAED